jgi:hypothetical protein
MAAAAQQSVALCLLLTRPMVIEALEIRVTKAAGGLFLTGSDYL